MSLTNNVKWIGLSQLVKIFSQKVSIFYLTRLISPDEYGLLAMTAIVMNLAVIFSDMGTGAAIVQRQNITLNFYNIVYKLNVIVGFFIMCLIFLSTPMVVGYFERPELYNLFFLLALVFPITAFGIVHKAKLEKEQKFKKLAKIEIFCSMMGILIAVILANAGAGVYSIITQTIFFSLFTTVLYKINSKLHLMFFEKIDKSEIVHIYNFSGNLLLFNLVNYFSRNLDVILIGKYFSAVILGAYSVAYRIMLFPVQSMSFVVSRALLPHISNDLGNIDSIKKNYFHCIFIICALTAPLMLGISSLSDDVVNIFFKKEWGSLAAILVWLAPIAIIQSVLSTSGAIFTAFAKTNWLFYLGCVSTILYVFSFYVGIKYDIVFFVKMYFIANLLNFFPVMFLVGKVLKFSIIDVILILARAIFPAVIMFCSIMLLNLYYHEINILNFLLKIMVGSFIYLLFFVIFNIKFSKMVLSKIRQD